MNTNVPPYKGEWRDIYYDKEGNKVRETPWRHNQVQDDASTAIATLLRETRIGVPASFAGIQYLALGEGLASWDVGAPTQPRTEQTLENETHRLAIAPSNDIVYLDPSTEAQVAYRTRLLLVVVTIPLSVEGTLREFGLAIGDATSAQDSGYLMNWIVHDKIEKTTNESIRREIKLRVLTHDEITVL